MQAEQGMSDLQRRMSQPLEYNLSDNIFIDRIEVEGKLLHFKKYDESETIATIQKQFKILSKGKELPLTRGNIVIDPHMPLTELASSPQEIKALEQIVNSMVKNEEVKQEEFEEKEQPVI